MFVISGKIVLKSTKLRSVTLISVSYPHYKPKSDADYVQDLYDKPDWSTVRWIHAPLNHGLVHSSLEDRFLAPDRHNLSAIGFPYLQVETCSLRKRSDLEDMRDVQRILQSYKEVAGVTERLNQTAEEGIGKEMLDDIRWRAGHHRLDLTFWELVKSDFQRQLSEGPSIHIDYSKDKVLSIADVDNQMISSLPIFDGVQIVRYTFRCFHRSDGFLLTMAPAPGLDYLDVDLQEHLDRPRAAFFDNEHASVIGLMFELFAKSGTSTWHKKSVDWFMVYLLTEVAASPHNVRQGGNAPQLGKAYQKVVQDLKNRRYLEFQRKESVKLVREYLSCIDELTNIGNIIDNSISVLEGLRVDIEKMERDNPAPADNAEGESALERVNWAIGLVGNESLICRELLQDLRQSLTAVCSLSSIQDTIVKLTPIKHSSSNCVPSNKMSWLL
jgi:hypothetical protein